ncbi:MAG: hypothetical protein RL272_661 [Candidatus Parcubacteria bacterium]|jgi:hypothetical protein
MIVEDEDTNCRPNNTVPKETAPTKAVKPKRKERRKKERPPDPYEQLVQDVYQALLQQEAVKNIAVQRQVALVGRSGVSHVVDVYWEFELSGHRYRTCVECKALNRRVKKSEVLTLLGVVNDLTNCNGAFVTTVGYQRGAKEIGKHNGVRLLVCNPVLQAIHTTINARIPNHTVSNPRFDENAVRVAMANKNLREFNLDWQAHGDSMLVNANGQPVETLNDLIRREVREEGHHVVSMAGRYWPSEIGPLPMVSVECDLRFAYLKQEMLTKFENAAKALLEDVLANTQEYVTDDGKRIPAIAGQGPGTIRRA